MNYLQYDLERCGIFLHPVHSSVSIWNTTKLHNCNFPSNFRNYVSQLPKVEAYFAIFQIAAKVEKAIRVLGKHKYKYKDKHK